MKKALFLDRDGIINIDKGYVFKKEDFEFVSGIFDALRYFQSKGYLLIIITNQAGIARGYYTEEDFHSLTQWMLNKFKLEKIRIFHVYYSPFHPVHGMGKYRRKTLCRKPNPGMLIQAQKDYNIELHKSILIGDKMTDIEAGISAGVKLNILLKSEYVVNSETIKADLIIDSIKDLISAFKNYTKIN